jgi:predicted RNA polymerase sigma factor
MVTLNHAIAAAMVYGPSKGLELLRTLDGDPQLAGHYRLHAVRGHLLEMTGDFDGAIEYYSIAASRTTSIPEQNYLMTQAARLLDTKVAQKDGVAPSDGHKTAQ